MSDAEIHSTAVIGKDVKLGAGTRVGAHAVIEDGVIKHLGVEEGRTFEKSKAETILAAV